jgi:hypothetical protein
MVREELQKHAGRDLDDYFVFFIGLPIMDLVAAPYGGARFTVDARLDGRTFVKFHVDVGIGDAVLEPLESITTRNWLGFAGIAPPEVPMVSKEQQFAEKLHAYTLPERETTNSRVKDLVDMALLIGGELEPEKVRHALGVTFNRRKTHNFPEKLNPPPDHWQPVFKKLAGSCGINDDIGKTFSMLNSYIVGLDVHSRQSDRQQNKAAWVMGQRVVSGCLFSVYFPIFLCCRNRTTAPQAKDSSMIRAPSLWDVLASR